MERTSFEGVNCSVAQCLQVVGEWWSLLIVRDAFLGVTRFDDFQARLEISRNTLTKRLNHLVRTACSSRCPTGSPAASGVQVDRQRPRSVAGGYRHASVGRPMGGTRRPASRGRHDSCGHVVEVLAVCSHCGGRLGPRDLTAIPGSGATQGDFARTRVAVASPREPSPG